MTPGSKPPPGDYTLDDLIADEKRQTRWVLVIFVGAVLFVGGRSLIGGSGADLTTPPDSAAPVTSRR